MVSTETERREARANEYIGIMDSTGFTGWLDSIDSSEREGRLIDFFGAVIPEESIPASRVSGFIDLALDYLEARRAHDAYIAVGLEVRSLAAARSLESVKSLVKIEGLLSAIKAAGPDGALKQELDAIVSSEMRELQECIEALVDLSGLESEKAESASTIQKIGDMCSEKFQDMAESAESREADEEFYAAINSRDTVRLEKALKRKKEMDISYSMERATEFEERAKIAAKNAAGRLSNLIASKTKLMAGREQLLRVVLALAYVRTKTPRYRLIGLEVFKPVLESKLGVEAGNAPELAGEILGELLEAACEPSERSMCKAALLIARLSATAGRFQRKG
ncbi:MAG: hypothetical protein LVQ95_00625 [Candidatus Micrarchaeales archaeon]|nr:hypothetical protein [Candidatus Micrarchaeales archaeon]